MKRNEWTSSQEWWWFGETLSSWLSKFGGWYARRQIDWIPLIFIKRNEIFRVIVFSFLYNADKILKLCIFVDFSFFFFFVFWKILQFHSTIHYKINYYPFYVRACLNIISQLIFHIVFLFSSSSVCTFFFTFCKWLRFLQIQCTDKLPIYICIVCGVVFVKYRHVHKIHSESEQNEPTSNSGNIVALQCRRISSSNIEYK